MSTSSREKQALGVFVVLIVLGFCGLCWYLVAGHSWNVAASAIDEKVGQMDGYTAIVYSGTVLPEVDEASAASRSKSFTGVSSSSSSDDVSSSSTLFGSSAVSSKKSASSSASSSGVLHSEAASGLTSDIDGVAAPVVSDSSAASNRGEAAPSSDALDVSGTEVLSSGGDTTGEGVTSESAADEGATAGSSDASAESSGSTLQGNGFTPAQIASISPNDVCDSYEDKGAQVLVLDTMHPSVYEDGAIIKRGGKRIGVFYVDVPLSEEVAQERIAYFKNAKVDMTVCISSVRAYVRNAQGIDIVITLQDDDVSTMGSSVNGTFYVNAPKVQMVGAILVSPSNVVSAKVVEAL